MRRRSAIAPRKRVRSLDADALAGWGWWRDAPPPGPVVRDSDGYRRVKDGDVLRLPVDGSEFKLSCCSCGLTHDLVFTVRDGKLFMRSRVNDAETERRRALMMEEDADAVPETTRQS
jgi:hypothetical protein